MINKPNGAICGAEVPSPSNSTSSMKNHLKNHHSIVIGNLETKPKLAKIESFCSKVDCTTSYSLEHTVARIICCDLVSINLLATSKVYDYLFKKVFNFTKLTHHFIWKCVMEVEQEVKIHLKFLLSNIDCSISCDDWTDKTNYLFTNIIAKTDIGHFSLGLIQLVQSDGDYLAQKIIEKCTEFGLDPKFITTDGASNMRKMTKTAGLIQQQCLIRVKSLTRMQLAPEKINIMVFLNQNLK